MQLSEVKLSEEDYRHHHESEDGFCITCLEFTRDGNTEPDARDYPCDKCHNDTVIGTEEALLEGWFEIE